MSAMFGAVAEWPKGTPKEIIEMGNLTRDLHNSLYGDEWVEPAKNAWNKISSTLDAIRDSKDTDDAKGVPVITRWTPLIKKLMDEFRVFLTLETSVKNVESSTVKVMSVTKKGKKMIDVPTMVQSLKSVSIGEIRSGESTSHIHAGCPYHMEDNFSHCTLAMMTTMCGMVGDKNDTSITPEAFMEICRCGFSAYCHDIGKPCTTLRTKKFSAYPCHGIAGSIMCRHLWANVYTRWFTSAQWNLMMCDVPQFHMYGMSASPNECKSDHLACLLKKSPELFERLRNLAIVDKQCGFTQDGFTTSGSVASDLTLVDALKKLTTNANIGDFVKKYNLTGVFIRLLGTSSQGKSTTANDIVKMLLDNDVPESMICIVSRDSFIVSKGNELLGTTDASYKVAYDAVHTHKDAKALKIAINDDMKSIADAALEAGKVVLYDTCANWYSGARANISPSGAKTALRIDVYPVSQALVTQENADRKGMTLEAQIGAANLFDINNVMHGVAGRNMFGLNEVRPVPTKSDPLKFMNGNGGRNAPGPHFAFTVSTAPSDDVKENGIGLDDVEFSKFITRIAEEMEFDEGDIAYDSMNLQELISSLDKKYCRGKNPEEIMEFYKMWFGIRAYNVSFPLQTVYRKFQYWLAVKEGDVEKATELKEKLAYFGVNLDSSDVIGRMTLEGLRGIIPEIAKLCSDIFLIKYRDGMNYLYKAPWHIQARSPLIVFGEYDGDDRVAYVFSAMPRGPEVAADVDQGITETQDVKDVRSLSSLAPFAPHYHSIIRSFLGINSPEIEEVECSFKKDGMCFRVITVGTSHPVYHKFQRMVELIDDTYVNEFTNASLEVSGGKFMAIPASNGTGALTSSEIQNWMICAMCIGEGVAHKTIQTLRQWGLSAVDIMCLVLTDGDNVGTSVLTRFVTKLIHARSEAGYTPNDVAMYTFEAIGGPNRMCAFDTQPHTELAASYRNGSLAFLGTSHTDVDGDLTWIPHAKLTHKFAEPVWFKFKNALECKKALSDLSLVTQGVMTIVEYLTKYPAHNVDTTRTIDFDPEGFVAYFKVKAFGKTQFVYCKAKTWKYYIYHKFRIENVGKMLADPDCVANWFPAHSKVKKFYSNIEMLVEFVKTLVDAVSDEEMINAIPAKARPAVESAKARGDMSLVFKIVLNNASDVWPSLSFEKASPFFPNIAILRDALTHSGEQKGYVNDCASTFKALMMHFECYTTGWETRLADSLNIENVKKNGLCKPLSGLWQFC